MRIFSFFKQTKQKQKKTFTKRERGGLGTIRTGTLERFAYGKKATRPNLYSNTMGSVLRKKHVTRFCSASVCHDRSTVAERRLFVPDRCPIIISSTNSRAPAAPACLKHIDVGHRQGWEA